MEKQDEHKVDRTGWRSGPWDLEPDKVEWEVHGFPALAVRNDLGAWCGYVGVPRSHPAYGAHYDKVEVEGSEWGPEVHGGLTYSGKCRGHICHTPKPGQSDDVWWLGFDCAHYMDIAPGLDKVRREIGFLRTETLGETYKDLNFVKSEVRNLALQLKKPAAKGNDNQASEPTKEVPQMPPEGRVIDI